ncbi:PhnD/SsuA/transferrin family substrate-binding protein [Marinospirillum sp.]|uniref:sensor histidine kinase n=1 Tax=Marinospirillum sp. TaxID=2183934 RepID=UPI0028709C10|nr:PhnD/SsuA/transferrin family substrate-binding protein [Marinospirillum sp.]MDR9467588.1 PhnD/SsuA/transferrin family substrate-binding protein [Marinospirillum sp.]
MGLLAENPSSRVHLGVLAWRDAPSLQQGWQTTLQALEEQLPEYHLKVHWLDLQELEQAIAGQELDFVLTNPGHYVDLSSRYLLAPLASLQNSSVDPPQQAIGSVVVTLSSREELNDWQDLRGQRLAAVSPDAFGGFQLVQDALEQADFPWQEELASLQFSGFPMEQLLGWLDAGRADAVVLRSCLLESLAEAGAVELSAYRVVAEQKQADYPCLHSSRLYPDWPFLRLGSTNPELARQVTLALLSSHPQKGEVDSYQWTAPLSYQPVYELFERLRLGPFADFPKNPVLAFVQQHRYWLLAALLLVLAVFGHDLRAGYLIRKKTRELKAAEITARQKQQELVHLSRFALMGELTAGLAHELNQPLTAIINYARGSERYLQQPGAQQLPQAQQLQKAMGKIVRQAEQAAATIKNLRSFLRKESPEWQELEPLTLMEEALEFMEAHFRQEAVTVTRDYSSDLPRIRGNPVQLLQILINLLTNASDAMQQLPVAQRQLEVTCKQVGHHLQIQIRDQGPGLTEEAEKLKFTPFFTTKKQGMGLGLGLSLSLTEAHQGQLSLHNTSSTGAVATLKLPVT